MFEPNSGIPGAEIVVIGNEVTSGLICDSNSAHIANRLMELGVDTRRITTVGDDEEAITDAVTSALARVDRVILTGGLGATHDDITKKCLANLFKSGFLSDAKVLAMIEAIYEKRGRPVPSFSKQQSQVPEKAVVLYNEKGTAPGLLFREKSKSVYALPGVPLEMEHLLEKYIVPDFAGLNNRRLGHRILHTTGITESGLWQKFGPIESLQEWVTLASLPSHLGVRIRCSAWAETEQEVEEKLDRAEQQLREKLGEHIFGCDEDTLPSVVGDLLSQQGKTLAVAESCTGGLIGHWLTNVSGSSEYFMQGQVTYSNSAKVQCLGVPEALIANHGAVSREVAQAMAEGVRARAGTDVGLSVTGIAGPTGGSELKPVGLTYIAVSLPTSGQVEEFRFHQDRVRNKERAAQAALNMVRCALIRT